MKNDYKYTRGDLIAALVIALLIGVVLGQAWSCSQRDNREDLCRRFGTYCEQ